MPNPSRKWDQIPVYAWYYQRPGVPSVGSVVLTVSERVHATDGRKEIYPAGAQFVVGIGKTEDQDPAARAEIHDAMKVEAEAAASAASETWDPIEWETEWDAALSAAIFTYAYLSDDPNVSPNGWQLKVEEKIGGQSVKPYYVEPLSALLLNDVPGINLGTYELPPGSAVTPAPIYAKGQAGGIAALSINGFPMTSEGVEIDPAGLGGASTVDELTDATPIGKTIVKAVDAAAVRTAIGAGTSSVAIGTASGTAADAAVTTAALAAKAPTASPTFTGTVSGVTKTHVGLANVDNTSDAAKPVSTATQAALDVKLRFVSLGGVTLSGRFVVAPDGATYTGGADKQTGDIVATLAP